jgi:hydroxymethylpyrimidine pyrophosphatase-like HAD family hydrolase
MTAPTVRTANWLVACDLDQTLIYSRRAFRLPPNSEEPAVLVVEYLDGEPLSYLTHAAAQALSRLAQQALVVPVTTRTMAQYRRINLGFQPEYAIAANGGHLIVDGVADPGWERSVRTRLAASGQPIGAIRELADELAAEAERAGRPWVRTIRDADGLFVYLVAHDRTAIPGLGGLEAALASTGWTLSVQGRKVYLVPAGLTKEAAIGEVRRRSGAGKLVAAGDSLLDLGMLRAADVAVRPGHGELHEQALTLAHLRVSRGDGILGGEEIVAMLAGIVAASGVGQSLSQVISTT